MIRFALALAILLALYVVGDFADRLNAYLDKPLWAILELYAFKSVVIVQQLLPAAMILGAAATASGIARHGEWTALRALGFGQSSFLLPALAAFGAIAVIGIAFDEFAVTRAGPIVDRLLVQKFNRWGDYRHFYFPARWQRVEGMFVFIRGDREMDGARLRDVTMFEVDSHFQLIRRVDTPLLRHLDGATWVAEDATTQRFHDDAAQALVREPSARIALPGTSSTTFAPRVGRPEYMRVSELLQQSDQRQQSSNATIRARLALHGRFAYPASGAIGTMVAMLLALRSRKSGQLVQALLETMGIVIGLYAALLISKGLAMGAHIPPPVAAWTPGILLASLGALLWWRSSSLGRSLRLRVRALFGTP